MKLAKLIFAFAAFSLLTFSACKKEDSKTDNTTTAQTCYVTKYTDSAGYEVVNTYLSNGLRQSSQEFNEDGSGTKVPGNKLSFTYNAQNKLQQMIDDYGSGKEIYSMVYDNEFVTSIEYFDSSSTGNDYQFTIDILYTNSKFLKWKIYDKAEPTAVFASADFTYDAKGGLASIIISEDDGTGMVPSEKIEFTNDANSLADPRLGADIIDISIFYLVFSQAGAKQFNNIKFFSYNGSGWDFDDSLDFINTYDSKGNLTKFDATGEKMYFNWSCK